MAYKHPPRPASLLIPETIRMVGKMAGCISRNVENFLPHYAVHKTVIYIIQWLAEK
jgi:hypothetical protein